MQPLVFRLILGLALPFTSVPDILASKLFDDFVGGPPRDGKEKMKAEKQNQRQSNNCNNDHTDDNDCSSADLRS